MASFEVRPKLEVVSSGDGGIEELQANIPSDAEVLWALLRVSLGSGSFARSKVVLIHFNGEDSPAVRRACDNALANEVKQALRRGGDGGDCFHACIELNRAAEVTEQKVMEMISEFFIVDHVGDFNSSWATRERGHGLTTEHCRLESAQRRPPERSGRGRMAPVARSVSDLTPSTSDEDLQRGLDQSDASRHRARRNSDSTESDSSHGLHYKQRGLNRPVGDAREALKSVANDGCWNWVLVGPDPTNLPELGRGSGSFEELRRAAEEHSDTVSYALLRLQFGVGRLKRMKFVFLHLIGDQVPAIRRGRENLVRPAMEAALKGYATWSASFLDVSVSNLSLGDIIERVRQVSVVDDTIVGGDKGASTSLFSLEAFEQALQIEQATETAGKSPFCKETQTPMTESPSRRRRNFLRSGSRLSEGRRSLNGSSSSLEGFDTVIPGTAPYGPEAAEREVEDILQLLQYDQTRNWALFRCRAPKARLSSGSLGSGPLLLRSSSICSAASNSNLNSNSNWTSNHWSSSSNSNSNWTPNSAPNADSNATSNNLNSSSNSGSEMAGAEEKQYEAVDETPMAARGSLKDRASRFEKDRKAEA